MFILRSYIMKKLALALVATAFVIGAADAKQIQTGFYAGIHGGYGANTAKFNAQTNPASPGSVDIGSGAGNLGIHGGYGYVSHCLYVGGEVSYTWENAKISNNFGQQNGRVELKRNGYARVALRGGWLFSPTTMGYIALGGNWGKWTLNDNANNGNFGVNTPGSGSKNRFSFAPGVGLETAVARNVYLRAEYTYEWGPSVRAVNQAVPNISDTASNIRSQSAKLGISYKF
jgi:outer membrane immunogenic protein